MPNRDMQVVRFNPILCCSILRNAPHFFVSTSAIPVNRYLTECDFVRKPRLPPDKLLKINNLSVETYHLADKLHFESQWFQELVLRNRAHKKHGKAMSRKAFFAAHCTHRFDPLHWGRLSEKSNILQ